jgi:hypothetical protein
MCIMFLFLDFSNPKNHAKFTVPYKYEFLIKFLFFIVYNFFYFMSYIFNYNYMIKFISLENIDKKYMKKQF